MIPNELAAFVGGLNVMMALWCGRDWLRERRPCDVWGFWINAGFGAANVLAAFS